MSKKIYFFVFLGAFLLRLGVLVGYKDISNKFEQFDARDYQEIALSLTRGEGFTSASGVPTSTRPPVYPLFLAAIYSVSGHSDTVPRLLQCLLDSGSAVLLMLIAGLLFGPGVAVLSGALAAVYPPLILYSNLRLTECLFTFLLLLECYFLTRAFKDRDNGRFAWAGVFHGIAVLVRSNTLLFPAFLLPAAFFAGLRRNLWKGFVAYALIGSAIISIWTVRNYKVLDAFLPVNAGAGWLLWFSVQDDAWDGDVLVELNPLREYPELKDLPRAQMEAEVGRRVVRRALREPFWYAGKMARNFVRLWTLPVGKVMLSRVSPPLGSALQAAHYLLLAVALCGLFLISRANLEAALPSLFNLLYVSVMHSMVLSVPRYRLPFDPLLLMFFSAGLFFLYGRFRRKGTPVAG